MSSASARKAWETRRAKALAASGNPPQRESDKQLAALTPVATFSLPVGDFSQRFACLPSGGDQLDLVVVSRRGFRSVGQWPFKSAGDAKQWASQQVTCNGRFLV